MCEPMSRSSWETIGRSPEGLSPACGFSNCEFRMPLSHLFTRQKPRNEVRRMNQPEKQSVRVSKLSSCSPVSKRYSPTVIKKNDSHSAVAAAIISFASSSVIIPPGPVELVAEEKPSFPSTGEVLA